MTIQEIARILKYHSVPFKIENNNIYADSMINGTALFEKVENCTRWSRKKLFIWLGY